jgi:hypothetical protein
MDLFIVGVCNTVVEADEILTSELLTFELAITAWKVVPDPILGLVIVALVQKN